MPIPNPGWQLCLPPLGVEWSPQDPHPGCLKVLGRAQNSEKHGTHRATVDGDRTGLRASQRRSCTGPGVGKGAELPWPLREHLSPHTCVCPQARKLSEPPPWRCLWKFPNRPDGGPQSQPPGPPPPQRAGGGAENCNPGSRGLVAVATSPLPTVTSLT